MIKEKTREILKTGSILLVFVLVFVGLYKYGYKIPVLKEIPFFATGHDHQYIPVFTEEGEIDYWTCTMHPSVKLKEPGKCPICSMDLVPVKKRGSQTKRMSKSMEKSAMSKDEGMQESRGMENMNMEGSSNENMGGMQGMSGMSMGNKSINTESKSLFTVSPERQQIIGVKTEPVLVRQMKKVIRTVGIVKPDETKIKHVNTKISGWIDNVFVDFTWQHVKRGDPLFSIYSPELLSTQEEYLLAIRSKKILGDNQFPEIARGSNSLVEATKRRLQLWDISENQIKGVEKTGKPKESLVIYSPATGYVTQKNAFENMYVEPNMTIYTVADHTTVWVDADIYENEISLVKIGQEATMKVESIPSEEFRGKITFISPELMPKTRTIKVRIEFPNSDLKLLPEMYAKVQLEIPIGEKLTVPESAVLRTGKQDVVFLDKGEGNMEIRKVELGHESDEYYEVLRGLSEGEKVVSRANFLIDAESKVQAAVATWGENSTENKETTHEMEFLKEEKSE